MEAQLALPFEEDRDTCTIYLNISREEVEWLKKGFPITISDLINCVIVEADKEIP